jgi:hypothetical protein
LRQELESAHQETLVEGSTGRRFGGRRFGAENSGYSLIDGFDGGTIRLMGFRKQANYEWTT